MSGGCKHRAGRQQDVQHMAAGLPEHLPSCLGNKTFILNVYHSISREHLERYLYQLAYDLLIGVVEEKAVGLSVSDRDKAFIADFYKYAFVGLMLNWIREGMKEDPTAIIDRLSVLIHGDITRALHKYSAH